MQTNESIQGRTRRGVRRNENQAQVGGDALRSRLLSEVVFGAREARQPVEHRVPRSGHTLRRKERRELHFALQHGAGMREFLLQTAEAAARETTSTPGIMSTACTASSMPQRPLTDWRKSPSTLGPCAKRGE